MKKILLVILTFLFLIVPSVNASESTTEAILQYNQGIDYYKVGQYDSAISSFRAAIKLNPNYIDAYYNLGAVLEYLQQYDAALAVFKQIMVRKPDDYDSVYKAAWLSNKLGEPQKARTYLSIIPPTCARGKDAKELASQLDVALGPQPQSSASESKVALPKSSVNQTSGLYQDVPAPTGIASDKEGNVYVAEFNTNSILKFTPDNKKELYLKDSKISGPIGIAIDSMNTMYIANYNRNNVLKVSPYGEITVLISNVKKPYCLHLDGNILFVSCQGSNSVLRYKLH